MTMNMLAQAQGVCGTTAGQDEDMVDYINGLRESVLEAYSGIVQVSLRVQSQPRKKAGCDLYIYIWAFKTGYDAMSVVVLFIC